jgi:beta-glucanase (GH16 family)
VEEQYFTDRLKNAEVRDGKLFITADEEEYENRYYTSARLKTHGLAQWLYGRFEIYAKLAPGQGTWSAFWLLPHNYYEKANWPGCGEIDIMENVGQMPDTIHGTVHTMKYNHMRGTHKSGTITVPDCYREFHLYTIEWTPKDIIWYVDEKEYFSYVKEADSINV